MSLIVSNGRVQPCRDRPPEGNPVPAAVTCRDSPRRTGRLRETRKMVFEGLTMGGCGRAFSNTTEEGASTPGRPDQVRSEKSLP